MTEFSFLSADLASHRNVNMTIRKLITKTQMSYHKETLVIFCRDGKYTHACVCSLQPGCVQKDGTRQVTLYILMIMVFIEIVPFSFDNFYNYGTS